MGFLFDYIEKLRAQGLTTGGLNTMNETQGVKPFHVNISVKLVDNTLCETGQLLTGLPVNIFSSVSSLCTFLPFTFLSPNLAKQWKTPMEKTEVHRPYLSCAVFSTFVILNPCAFVVLLLLCTPIPVVL
ncbi:Coproporphyrin III ferrochelatase [Frankliniella fusca]|uniref:Coproporphyrin III ferrochelatase n=1 Tax=Frankliniella fusca TaxID=407009 RepID=A0AAE1HGQ1_9NEOP|nr:Coproporphyrin III ferrochelatase [Frankliniella fusca]